MEASLIQDQGGVVPWYVAGLKFQCGQCGNCCTGGRGYVWISQKEIARVAESVKLDVDEVVQRYCRQIGPRWSLQERLNGGNYDCIFLEEQRGVRPGEVRRICTVYAVRPLQCRTWPFWASNLASPDAWNQAVRRCPGMNQGRSYNLRQIHQLRDDGQCT